MSNTTDTSEKNPKASDPIPLPELADRARVLLLDIDAVVVDALRPLDRRTLGRVSHKKMYREALRALRVLLDHASPPSEEKSRG